jgi:hypothetical protein
VPEDPEVARLKLLAQVCREAAMRMSLVADRQKMKHWAEEYEKRANELAAKRAKDTEE